MGRDARSAARLRLAHRKARLAKLSAVTPQARGARKTAQPIPSHQAPPPRPPPPFRHFPPTDRSPPRLHNTATSGFSPHGQRQQGGFQFLPASTEIPAPITPTR